MYRLTRRYFISSLAFDSHKTKIFKEFAAHQIQNQKGDDFLKDKNLLNALYTCTLVDGVK